MKPLQKLKQLWHSNTGYAMILVLCALLLFTVLGANALLAAQASAGTTARKKDDNQAYVLSVSALRCVSTMIEQGDFSKHITKLLNSGGKWKEDDGKPIYSAPVTAQIALPQQAATLQPPKITVDFTAEGVRDLANPTGGTVKTVDSLTARITVHYLSATYSFLADFRPQANIAEQNQAKWVLKGYRNNRVYIAPATY